MAEVEDRRSQILDAAFEEFAAKGFKGATIKSIASEAGVNSPALIYHYFPDKEALFNAVLETHAPIRSAIENPASFMDRPPEEVLPEIARAYFATVANPTSRRMMKLMLGEAMRRPQLAEMIGRATAVRVLGFLKGYLSRQVELGRLRPHDVRSSARAFVGMLIPQAAGKILFTALREDGLEDEEHIETAVNIFLEGLKPK
ncbi:MAG: TetR/AcrR family transcriptional regulator [Actinomycetota bacterium]|jgi:TetR/AcrR family transcriptional regulator|nr:TetR/AcrR family transcriptional regulator [Rubrobacter sp.]MDQ3567981.1 TetR/AcrR family transcriptional regulator [Actinomycetota bacterium]